MPLIVVHLSSSGPCTASVTCTWCAALGPDGPEAAPVGPSATCPGHAKVVPDARTTCCSLFPGEAWVMLSAPHCVEDVMTKTVVAVALHARFKDIVTAMGRWNVTAVPVVDGKGRVVGIVSEADLLRTEELRGTDQVLTDRSPGAARAGAVRAEDLMSAPPVTIRAAATLPHAARLMARRHVKRLPVVDAQGFLKGIVSRADLLKVFFRADDDIAAEVRDVLDRLFAGSGPGVRVRDGVVTLGGAVGDSSLVPLACRLAQAVEGVVVVRCELGAPSGPTTDAKAPS
ncbi:CBS domain-containing protein [Streptomyces sp. NPDC019539]|uniref:CBS domain-containing protein n=1 Tax=Streptomyces sp. NPDC019539 TaxID=3365063 RepID=UPI0037B5B38D